MVKKKRRYYNRTNTCDMCGEKKLVPHSARREYDNKGNWTGRWLCFSCWQKNDYNKRPDNNNNLMKKITNCRIGNINLSSPRAKGNILEEVTVQWRGVKNLNIDNDNYNSPIDHSRDPELGIIQTKCALFNEIKKKWHNGGCCNEYGKYFDYLIFYCVDKNMKNVERIYIFPRIEVVIRTSITIYNSCCGWYEKYRVKDEKILEYVNEIFGKIMSEYV